MILMYSEKRFVNYRVRVFYVPFRVDNGIHITMFISRAKEVAIRYVYSRRSLCVINVVDFEALY